MDALSLAIASLYNAQGGQHGFAQGGLGTQGRQAADTFLQSFRSAPDGSWKTCVMLLQGNVEQQYFASNSLKYFCQRGNASDAQTLAELLPALTHALIRSVQVNGVSSPVTSMLATALGMLVVRAPTWAPAKIIMDLEALLLNQSDAGLREAVTLAMLKVLAALPAVLSDKLMSVHPNRRLAVSEALAVSPSVRPWIATAFSYSQTHQSATARQSYLSLGLSILGGWCELGALPLDSSMQAPIVQQVCQAVFMALPGPASETMVSMLQVCKDTAVLPGIVEQWQVAFTAARQQQGAAQQPKEVLQAVCSVLCAIGNALLAPTLGGDSRMSNQFGQVAEQLLQQLASTDDDVALTALDFWSDTYIVTLQGLPADARKGAMVGHTPLLQHLCAALVMRARLEPDVALTATADARDLPEHVRMVRRELASALRDITCLVGVPGMTQFMAQLVQSALAQYTSSPAIDMSTGHPNWTHLECALYAANVVLGQCTPPGGGARGQGQGADGTEDAAVMALVEVASACATLQPGVYNCPKLPGTALTLLGGLSSWYMAHPEALNVVLPSLTSVLQSPDTKLSRNGATTIYRLCQHKQLASVLLSLQRAWVESVLQLYQAMGGVQRRMGHGDDLPTEELLLAALCHIATSPGQQGSSELLVHLAAPKLHELQQAMAGLVACAPTALQMLLNTGAKSAEMDAAMQTEAMRAVAYAGAAGTCIEILQMVAECAGQSRSGAKNGRLGLSSQSSYIHSPRCFSHQHSGSASVSCLGGGRQGGLGGGVGGSHVSGQQEQADQEQLVLQQEKAASLVTLVAQCINAHAGRLPSLPPAVCDASCAFFTSALQTLTACCGSVLPGAVQMLQALPADQLVTPNALTLLAVCISAYASEAPHEGQQEGGASSGASSSRGAANGCGCPGSNGQQAGGVLQQQGSQQAQEQQAASAAAAAACADPLQRVAYTAVATGCSRVNTICDDPEYVKPLLQVCSGVVTTLPQLLTLPNTLDGMLAMTLATGRSYSQDQCKAWLQWVTLLASAPYGSVVQESPTAVAATLIAQRVDRLMPDVGSPGAHHHPPVAIFVPRVPQFQVAPASSPGMLQLSNWLDATAGHQLVLAMLMAASGAMPPDVILPVATALHQIWSAVGTQRFGAWLEAAVSNAPESAPWFKQKPETKAAAVRELLSKEVESDLGRFKKQVKLFCGGKKKLGGDRSLLNSRQVSRSSSRRSSQQLQL